MSYGRCRGCHNYVSEGGGNGMSECYACRRDGKLPPSEHETRLGAAQQERDRIVAWLRGGGPLGYMLPDEALETLARRIEAGEHIDDSAWREQR